jgi:hypothetical protein
VTENLLKIHRATHLLFCAIWWRSTSRNPETERDGFVASSSIATVFASAQFHRSDAKLVASISPRGRELSRGRFQCPDSKWAVDISAGRCETTGGNFTGRT